MNEVEEPHKRYLVFEYSSYYPSGGMSDCVLTTDDEQTAINRAKSSDYDFRHVYDRTKGETIYSKHF